MSQLLSLFRRILFRLNSQKSSTDEVKEQKKKKMNKRKSLNNPHQTSSLRENRAISVGRSSIVIRNRSQTESVTIERKYVDRHTAKRRSFSPAISYVILPSKREKNSQIAPTLTPTYRIRTSSYSSKPTTVIHIRS